MASHLWGIDLGGTKIEGVILQADRMEVVHRKRIPTEQEGGYEHIVSRIRLLVDQLADESGLQPSSIGIGTPGTTDPPTGLMKNCNTTALNGKPLAQDLARALQRPVQLANDANCFAVAEAVMGVVPQEIPNARLVFGVIMGTGVGGGLVIDGKPWAGGQGIGGEWGHTFLDHSGGHCYCGLTGCTETIISGPALERFYFARTGQKRKLGDIVNNHQSADDPVAKATMERLLHFFGRGIANLINTLDPDAIVIGGGVGNIEQLYTEGRKRVSQFIFNPRLNTPILKPSLGDSAGVFGAALLTK